MDKQKRFIEQATLKYKNRYDYQKVKFVTAKTKVTIVCVKHGEFEQTPQRFLDGRACKKCKKLLKWPLSKIKEDCVAVHGDRFDYSKLEYINSKTNVEIICKIHGAFFQRLDYHLKGGACSQCSASASAYSFKDFIALLKQKHIHNYEFIAENYINYSTKMKVNCPTHGEFKLEPEKFARGKGCQKCGHESKAKYQRFTTQRFITKAREKHGLFFDYSKCAYTLAREKVKIICPIHGPFEQAARKHLDGQGCHKCHQDSKFITKEVILKRFNEVHGDTYDYSGVVYQGLNQAVSIGCSKHKVFTQTPAVHLMGCGCQQCASESTAQKTTLPFDTFVKRAIKTHSNKYKYFEPTYKNTQSLTTIECHIHGAFQQLVASHLSGKGCVDCGIIKMKLLQTKPQDEFINECILIHNGKYDYSLVKYQGYSQEINIICPVHGLFKQTAGLHNEGAGCKRCAQESIGNATRKLNKTFILEAQKKYGYFYDYAYTDYFQAHSPVKIRCPNHGVFDITPRSHLNGRGCDKCGRERTKKARTLTTKEFIEKAITIHGDTYDYSSSEYVNAKTKVTIDCPEHGGFEQSPDIHLTGGGCQSCASYGFDYNAPAILYYVKVETFNQCCYKIGITNRTVQARFSSDLDKITILSETSFPIGKLAHDAEQKILNEFSRDRHQGDELLTNGGNTELFSRDVLKLDITQ